MSYDLGQGEALLNSRMLSQQISTITGLTPANHFYSYNGSVEFAQGSTISLGGTMAYNGERFMIVCNGVVTEMPENATMETTTERAGAVAHQTQATAYILKPVRKVAPKRDVVTTDL